MIAAATARAPAVGESAPDFSLVATTRQRVALSDFRGRKNVLLAFFPLAFTSTCTAELCAFRDDFDQFASHDVEVLGISVDSDATLREFKAKHALRTELLSDFHRVASRAYGVLLEERNYANRAYFLVHRDGVIRWAHVENNPSDRRENDEVFGAIARLAGALLPEATT